MYSYISPEARLRADHPLRKIRAMADEALKSMAARFDAMYARIGRPSIPPEKLLRECAHEEGAASRDREGGWVFTFAAAAYNLVRMRNLLASRVGAA
jgi:hypothetical protein